MAHTGLFVAPLAGSPPQGMSPTDGRLVLGGLFGIKGQLVSGGAFTASGTAMTGTVAQAVWQLTDVTNAAATFFSPTDLTNLTFGAAPATGGRIDSVVVKQNNVENGDADSRVNVYVVAGTASGSPTPPSVPVGAVKYLDVQINAGVANLAAATVTNYMQTTFGPPDIVAPSYSALQAMTGLPNQVAALPNGALYLYFGGAWRQLTGHLPYFRYHRTAAFNWTANTLQTMQWDASPVDGALEGMTLASGVFTCTTPGLWEFDGRIGATTGSSSANARWLRNGAADIEYAGGQVASGYTAAGGVYRRVLAAGDTIALAYISAATYAGVPTDGGTNQVTWLSGRYLGLY